MTADQPALPTFRERVQRDLMARCAQSDHSDIYGVMFDTPLPSGGVADVSLWLEPEQWLVTALIVETVTADVCQRALATCAAYEAELVKTGGGAGYGVAAIIAPLDADFEFEGYLFQIPYMGDGWLMYTVESEADDE